jgi:hypothetical protein
MKGLMDHWVPSRDQISKFWKQDLDTACRILDELANDIAFNHFTFYTKWYTNGMKSNLPYLSNHPKASNVRTGNAWGRSIIDRLHDRGVSVGAMIQFLTYESPAWEEERSVGEIELGHVAETELPVRIADITHPQFRDRIKAIIQEHLEQFPALDYLFLEFEGLQWGDVQRVYDQWSRQRGFPKERPLTYGDDVLDHCRRIGAAPSLIWSNEAREMLLYYCGLNLQAAKEAVDAMNYKGDVGIVIHSYGYETFIYSHIVPDRAWWLVPWNYWNTEKESDETEQKKAISKEKMLAWKREGRRVCYIGDVTIGPERGSGMQGKKDVIRDFYDFSVEHLDGYLGMGNPVPDIGLKWEGITDDHVLEMRSFYRELYGKRNKERIR